MFIDNTSTETNNQSIAGNVVEKGLGFVDMLGGAIVLLICFMSVPFAVHLFQGRIGSDFLQPAEPGATVLEAPQK